MKTKLKLLAASLLLSTIHYPLSTALAQGTAFTYQGQLNQGNAPANGHYDFIFQVFDAANAGNSLGGSLTTNSIGVSNGLFTVALDFGATPFAGQPRWLQIAVSTNGAGNYSTLLPRQPVTASPYAIYAGTAGAVAVGGITSAALANGAVGNGQLAVNAVNGTNIAGGQVVKSLNGLMDHVTLVAGDNVTLNTVGNSLQISAASGTAQLTNVALLNLVNPANVATAVPTIGYGFLVEATLTSYGSGYLTAPAVLVNDASGSGAVITATVSNGEVVGLTVQDAGFGYSAEATLAIAPPPSNAYQTFSGVNIFTGANTLTNPNNAFLGNFAGNGAGLTNVVAAAVATPQGMALVPAGVFSMGDSLDGEGDATPATNITVSAFYMDINLVSYAQWQSVFFWATNHGYSFVNAGAGKAANHPVQTVDWYDCVKWSNARSVQAGLLPVYYTDAGFTQIDTNGEVAPYMNMAANGYRLPTEAEWEKAARGGLSGQRYPWGNAITENLANYYGETASYSFDLGPNGYNTAFTNGVGPYTCPVGYFAPNGYGLYDMADDVTEWGWDWYGTPYGQPTNTNPTGPATGSYRVWRGGNWNYNAYFARCANRNGYYPSSAYYFIGFRCVRGH